ncbi:unnamed protein product [Rangifer tarandus platyrhynchus]|uniref:Uncharacterized protein n=1 Tax=Rangifer tarandus platyrhynchus TaxID=3082113 RepID=A0AC59YCG6_RANTA
MLRVFTTTSEKPRLQPPRLAAFFAFISSEGRAGRARRQVIPSFPSRPTILSHSVFSAQFERQADTGLRAQFRREPCSRVLCTSAPGPHPRPAPALARGCPPGPAGRSDRPRPPALPSLRLRTSHAALAQTTT